MNIIETMQFRKDILTMQFKEDTHGVGHPDSEDTTVALDFDGTLNESSGPYERGHFGPPIKEGMKLLGMCLDAGYTVVIFTARKETDLVANWLRDQGYPHMHVTNHKIPSSSYVDDRAIPWNAKESKAEVVFKFVKNPRETLKIMV